MSVEQSLVIENALSLPATAQSRMLSFFLDVVLTWPTLVFLFKIFNFEFSSVLVSLFLVWTCWIFISSAIIFYFGTTPMGKMTNIQFESKSAPLSFFHIIFRQILFSFSLFGFGYFQHRMLFSSNQVPFYDKWAGIQLCSKQNSTNAEVIDIFHEGADLISGWFRALVLSSWIFVGYQVFHSTQNAQSVACFTAESTASSVAQDYINKKISKECVGDYVDTRIWSAKSETQKELFELKSLVSEGKIKDRYIAEACENRECSFDKLSREASK